MVESASEGDDIRCLDELVFVGPGTRRELFWLDGLEHRQVHQRDLTLQHGDSGKAIINKSKEREKAQGCIARKGKIAASVLLKLFINERCHTTDVP